MHHENKSFSKDVSVRLAVFLMVTVFTIGSFALSPLLAQVDIQDVRVDVTAESGLKARDQGIVEARRKAFQVILNSDPRYQGSSGQGFPSDKDLEFAMETFEVQDEKISATRYIGTLTITFSTEGLERLLAGDFENLTVYDADGSPTNSKANKTVGDTSSAPPVVKPKNDTLKRDVILVPLYVTPDESYLWSKNPWREFWQRIPDDEVLHTTIPLGDLRDIMAVSIEDFMINRSGATESLMNRYNKSTVVFLSLKRFSNEGPDWELIVKIFSRGKVAFASQPIPLSMPQMSAPQTEMGGSVSDEQGLYELARVEAVKTIQDYQALGQVQNTAIQTVVLDAQFTSFAQWQQIRKGLKASPIKSFAVSNLSRKSAEITIQLIGSVTNLNDELQKYGLKLSESIPGRYTLGMIAANTTPTTSVPSTESPADVSRDVF